MNASTSTALSTVLEYLTDNQVLAALFILSPADALDYLELPWLKWMVDAPQAQSLEDRQQVALLKQALNDGKTVLDLPPLPARSATENHLLQSFLDAPTDAQPEARITIAETTLQRVLERYVAHNVAGVELAKYQDSSISLCAYGKDMQIDLRPGVAELRIDLRVKIAIAAFKQNLYRQEQPVSLRIGAGFMVDNAQQICLTVNDNQLQIVQSLLPRAAVNGLAHMLLDVIPPIPVFPVPVTMPLLDPHGQMVELFALTIANVAIGEQAAHIDLALLHCDIQQRSAG